MPRYANGSLEAAIYEDIVASTLHGAEYLKYRFTENPAKKERKNSTRSRALRAQGFVAPDPVTCGDRLSAIRGVLRLLENGWTSPEAAVTVIHNITKGE